MNHLKGLFIFETLYVAKKKEETKKNSICTKRMTSRLGLVSIRCETAANQPYPLAISELITQIVIIVIAAHNVEILKNLLSLLFM